MASELNLIQFSIDIMTFVTLLGFLIFLKNRGGGAVLDKRLAFLGFSVSLFLFGKICDQVFVLNPTVHAISILGRSLFPLGLVLVTESIMGHHAPKALKWTVVLLTAVTSSEVASQLMYGKVFGNFYPYALCMILLSCFWMLVKKSGDIAATIDLGLSREFSIAIPLLILVVAADYGFPVKLLSSLQLSSLGIMALVLATVSGMHRRHQKFLGLQECLLLLSASLIPILLFSLQTSLSSKDLFAHIVVIAASILFTLTLSVLISTRYSRTQQNWRRLSRSAMVRPYSLSKQGTDSHQILGRFTSVSADISFFGIQLGAAALKFGPVFSLRNLLSTHLKNPNEIQESEALLHILKSNKSTHGVYLGKTIVMFNLGNAAGSEAIEEDLFFYWALYRNQSVEVPA
jgi:hypothetical protein